MELTLLLVTFLYLLSAIIYCVYLFAQKDYLQKLGYCLLCGGFVVHSAAIIICFIKSGHLSVGNFQETLSIAGWAVAGVFTALRYKLNLKILGVFASPLVSIIMIASLNFKNIYGTGDEKIYNSFLFLIHVIATFIGEASFALACGAAFLYIVQENSIKTKKRGFFFKRLPSLELIDSTVYVCLVTGFTMLTIGLMGGMIYAKLIWSRFWSWDPKEVWSAVTWLVYAALIHGRLTSGWRGRRSAIMSIIGFGIILFTFLGVNLFLQGHHGEFTKW